MLVHGHRGRGQPRRGREPDHPVGSAHRPRPPDRRGSRPGKGPAGAAELSDTISRMSAIVTLRPVAGEDLPMLDRLRTDPAEASEFGFYGHRTPHATHREFAETGLLGEDGGRLTVLAGPEPVGRRRPSASRSRAKTQSTVSLPPVWNDACTA